MGPYLLIAFICACNNCYGLAGVAIVVGLLNGENKKGTT